MDNYRRRPPMEGFSRPGELGGEAFDDDSVEGHIMDERDDNPDSSFRRRVDENPGDATWKRAGSTRTTPRATGSNRTRRRRR